MAEDDAGEFPTVAGEGLESWTVAERTEETVFSLSAASIVGHTVIYEDDALRERVAAAGGDTLDRTWRFFFATRLTFSPPLPPMVGPAAVASTVRSEARAEFADTLSERGFRDVSSASGTSQRVRVDTGDRARLYGYTATLDAPTAEGGTATLPIEGWLAVWTTDGEFRLGGGAYPARSLADVLGTTVETDAGAFRDELLGLIRAVR